MYEVWYKIGKGIQDMRIKDLSEDQITPGLRIKGLKTGKLGTVVYVDRHDDDFAYIWFDDENVATSGFYGNDCDCEVDGHLNNPKDMMKMIKSAGVKIFLKIFIRCVYNKVK